MPQPCARMDKKRMSKKKTINTKKFKKIIKKFQKNGEIAKKLIKVIGSYVDEKIENRKYANGVKM